MATFHDLMITEPEAVTQMLLEVAEGILLPLREKEGPSRRLGG